MSRILVAEDDPVVLAVVEKALTEWGHEVVTVTDGLQAWEILEQPHPPELLVLDWMMPGLSGLEICQRVRASETLSSLYLIVLTSNPGRDNLLEGLQAGADDYLEKPMDPAVLRARIQVGERILGLQRTLHNKIDELKDALLNVRELRGLLPICSYCKKIRNDDNYWERLEHYLSAHTHAQFSHSICPDCYDSVVRQELDAFRQRKKED